MKKYLVFFTLFCVIFAKTVDSGKKDLLDIRFLEADSKIVKVKDYSVNALKRLNTYYVQTKENTRYFLLAKPGFVTYATVSYPIDRILCGTPEFFNIEYEEGGKEFTLSPTDEVVNSKGFYTNLTILFKNKKSLMLVIIGGNSGDETDYIVHYVDSEIDKNLSLATETSLREKNLQKDKLINQYSDIIFGLANNDVFVERTNKHIRFNNVEYCLKSIIHSDNDVLFEIVANSSNNVLNGDSNIQINLTNNSNFFGLFKSAVSKKVAKPIEIIKSHGAYGTRYVLVFDRKHFSNVYNYNLKIGEFLAFKGDIEINIIKDIGYELF